MSILTCFEKYKKLTFLYGRWDYKLISKNTYSFLFQIKSKFDSDLAWELIETWYGIDYGYEVHIAYWYNSKKC